MQFVSDGPDIPNELLQAHEDGRVVFFCGAGISYPAGLPGFQGLVEKIFELNGTTFTDIEKVAFEQKQYDVTLDLLERRLPGQRLAVRSKLAEALKPKLRRQGATDTQSALLQLARSRDGALRLVTTNFDRIFHSAANRIGQKFQTYTAPMLPIPKNSRWDGLVFLHGLLPAKSNETDLNRLVVTSGDFGLAYLTERWAARFVSELFRNYVVCFVGYSINDPVLRYMMDALAADKMLGEITPQAWALGDSHPGEESLRTKEWEAKGVKPILYNVPKDSHDHSLLHQTLKVWAETYRDGVGGKEDIIVKHALTAPQDSTQQDDFVGRVLWALSDPSGLPAKHFSQANPAPSLDWLLGPLSQVRFGHNDLTRFGVDPNKNLDPELSFSLICRFAPYNLAPRMLVASSGEHHVRWDNVMSHLASWLLRHLNDPRLAIWVVERGGHLHEHFARLIEQKIERYAILEHDGKFSELDDIRSNDPMAIPNPQMCIIWRFLLSGRVKSNKNYNDFYRWISRFNREGLTISQRLEIRELLAPKVILSKPFRWSGDTSISIEEPTRIKQLVDWELALTTDNVHSMMEMLDEEQWKSALPQLLEEFQQLLLDTLDLMHELGGADSHSDRSYWDLPSISPHWQNRGYREWVSLIELLRDAWLEAHSNDSQHATDIANNWFALPYPTFKRLALFAASHEGCISPEKWVGWLLADDAWWLWSNELGREVYRLLVLQGKYLNGETQARLEAAILAGPPREMYRADLEYCRWEDLVSRSVWLHLAKLESSGLSLGYEASARLADISGANEQWQLADNESDEFSHWMTGSGDPDFDASREVDIAPRKRRELVRWLSRPVSESKPFDEDTWSETCQTRFFHSYLALYDLTKSNNWPANRWRQALQSWSQDERIERSWRYVAPLLERMPDTTLQEIIHAVTWWIEAASRSINQHDNTLISLCRRCLGLLSDSVSGCSTVRNDETIHDPLGTAINHPAGHVTQALINFWFRESPNDNDLLPKDLKPIFTELCDTTVSQFCHGRVLLASRLIAFYRVDRQWAEQFLLPLFDWSNSIEAKNVWQGFLWSPRLYNPLLSAFKPHFLESSNHYFQLGELRHQFAVFLTYAALDPNGMYTVEDFREAIGALPQDGLEEVAQALAQAVEGSAEKSEEYWENRALPFWKKVWPKSVELATPHIAELLARLVIATRGKFPNALAEIKDWLKPIEHPNYILHLLYQSGLCNQFPYDAMFLLSSIISNKQWLPPELGKCLEEISKSSPKTMQDIRYRELWDGYRKQR